MVEIIRQIRESYPTPLGSSHAAFLIEAAQATKLGLILKSSGTRIILPDGTPVSQDCLMERDGSNHYDILIDAEGYAEPTWGEVGEIEASRYVDPFQYRVEDEPDDPIQDPNDPPVIVPDSSVEQKLDRILSILTSHFKE